MRSPQPSRRKAPRLVDKVVHGRSRGDVARQRDEAQLEPRCSNIQKDGARCMEASKMGPSRR
eukprot:6567137-Pyramimonas_sp.AAC.1